MKKVLLLSGPQQSGKTWISSGVINFFKEEEVLSIDYKKLRKMSVKKLSKYKLIIIDGFLTYDDILSSCFIKDFIPEMNLIMTTQIHFTQSNVNKQKFHLINCTFSY